MSDATQGQLFSTWPEIYACKSFSKLAFGKHSQREEVAVDSDSYSTGVNVVLQF